MFINKITSNYNNKSFKGYQHEINNIGKRVLRFNIPYDYENSSGYIEFYKLKENDQSYTGYDIIHEPIKKIPLAGKNGTVIDLDKETNLDSEEAFAYKIFVDGHQVKDSGIQKDGYCVVSRKGTTPLVQGPAILVMPKVHRPGASYNKDGEVVYNISIQKDAEDSINHFGSTPKGSLAGIQYDIPRTFKDLGIKKLFTNPILGADTISHHGYWNQNNMQLAPQMGTVENFDSVIKDLCKQGINYINDGTFTSEGLQGIHFQYATKWATRNPQTYYWFRLQGLKNEPLGLGVVPKNREYLRHKIINPPVILDAQTNSKKINPDYNPAENTYFQIYDKRLVTPEQEADLTKPIDTYQNLRIKDSLKISTHNDVVPLYYFDIDPNEYVDRVDKLLDYNKLSAEKIEEKSSDGAIFLGQFSNFKISEKNVGGYNAWDANTDMVKLNYHCANFDTKFNQSIIDPTERDFVEKQRQIGAFEVQDLSIQTGKYWTQRTKDVQTLFVAQTLKNIDNHDEIKTLIEEKKLPAEAYLTENQVNNILQGSYNLAPIGEFSKDKTTVRALMKLPLDTLELANDTVGVLSTSYFSNRATSEDTIGLSRFELMEQDNPHLILPYADTYIKVNRWFKNEIKDFADSIIEEVNKNSKEKLLDANGEYTEYGEYIINLIGPTITKHAMLKSLAGDHLKAIKLPDGQLTYNYETIRNLTNIKKLGITASSPENEAKLLAKKITKGFRTLNDTDIQIVSQSILKQITGTNTNSFRLAEAIVDKSGLGLDWRLDAAKDVVDMDAVRNGEMTFDEAWDKAIDFWAKFVKAIKAINPNAYIVAEITDVDNLLKDFFGEKANIYDTSNQNSEFKYKSVEDAIIAFFNKTGVTSEAGYSQTFTDMLRTFSADFVDGYSGSPTDFFSKLHDLVNKRGIDYIRNLFTFADNHDKPSVLHGMALDMKLFLANLDIFDSKTRNLNIGQGYYAREEAMKILTNSNSFSEMPLEAQLNIHNMDYFDTVSTKAVAMSKLFKDIIKEDLEDIASKQEIDLLNRAITDLTNGNYLGLGSNIEMLRLKEIPELQNIENALSHILKLGNLNISTQDFQAIVEIAKQEERIKRYADYGDFNWELSGTTAAEMQRERANRFFPEKSTNELMKYSTYTVAVVALIEEAFRAVKGNSTEYQAFINGGKSFIEKFDRKTIESYREKFLPKESAEFAEKKNAYACRDFETVIKMIIEQANYIASQEEKEPIKKQDEILVKLFRSSTEPAVQKAVMYSAYLSAFPGIPTIYLRNILGALGFDEKAKNIYLQNRNITPWSQLESGPLSEYRTQIFNMFKESMSIRTRDGVYALNNGTPYPMKAFVYDNPQRSIEKSIEDSIPAFLMQDGLGNMTVSVFNSIGIKPGNRETYDTRAYSPDGFTPETINKDNKYVPVPYKYDLDFIALEDGLALPVGLVFTNSDIRDEAKYIVKKIGEKLAIVNANGGRISLNEITAKNGVMVLKHVAQKIPFRGKQYNFATNPYSKNQTTEKGKNLSIIAG